MKINQTPVRFKQTKTQNTTQIFLEHIIDKVVIMTFAMLFFAVVSLQQLVNEINLVYYYKLSKFILSNDVTTISEIELNNKTKDEPNRQFHVIGGLKSNSKLTDELFGISIDSGLKLSRKVERFEEVTSELVQVQRRWVEVTCTSEEHWVCSKRFDASEIQIGNTKCNSNIITQLHDQVPFTIKEFDINNISLGLKNTLNINDANIMFESNFNQFVIRKYDENHPLNDNFMQTPVDGDMRISYDQIDHKIVSLVTKVSGNTLAINRQSATTFFDKLLLIFSDTCHKLWVSERRSSKNEILNEYINRNKVLKESTIQRLLQILLQGLSCIISLYTSDEICNYYQHSCFGISGDKLIIQAVLLVVLLDLGVWAFLHYNWRILVLFACTYALWVLVLIGKQSRVAVG